MTTVTLEGVRLFFDENGDSDSLQTAHASIILPSGSTTFSYTITGFDEGVPQIELDDNALEIQLDGETITSLNDNNDVQPFIVEVDWSGGTSVVLGVNIAPSSGGNDSEMYFVLDGPAPDVDNVADWEDFDASITAVRTPSGDFAPSTDIRWTDFVDASVSAEDDFIGTPGDDDFFGGGGDDYFRSSEGNDTYSGGKGFDQVTYDNSVAGVVVDLRSGTATDGWGDTDTLKGIEMVRGSAFDDEITGNKKGNHIRGLAGDDTLDGGGGRDLVRYDRDARYGGEAGVTVNLKKGYAIDGFGDRDTLTSFERVYGTDTGDKIIGSGKSEQLSGLGGNDLIKGGGGKDEIFGGFGRDRIDGGSRDDILTGNEGADRFIFKGNFGDDIITDFSTKGKREKVDLRAISEITSFNDLINNHAEENGDGDVVISDDDGNSITMEGVSIDDLSANDFLF